MNLIILITLLTGGISGGLWTYLYLQNQLKRKGKWIIAEAEIKSNEIITRAEDVAKNFRKEIEDARNDIKERKQSALEQESRLSEKEWKIDRKYEELEQKRNELMKKEQSIEERISSIDKKQFEIETKLEQVSRLSSEEAKELLMKYTEERYERDILSLIEKKRKISKHVRWKFRKKFL